MNETSIRLNKFLAEKLGVSRRSADDLIAHGRVYIGDTPAVLGSRLSPDQKLTVDGKTVDLGSITYVYIALNKPVGYVSSRRKQGEHETIYALLPSKFHELKPVGRLDHDSSGLLLLTNDGDFAFQMTHPKFAKRKEYEVLLNKPLQPLHRQMINDHGVSLDDGGSKLGLERLNDQDDTAWKVIMSEGRNRQIRRTFAALGYTVTKLHRTVFGKYRLNNLEQGKFEKTELL